MTSSGLEIVVRHIRRLRSDRDTAQLPDGQLLERFLVRQDQAALTALIERHGPLVLSVCQRVLHHVQDTEDAFQATFLLLVRKGSSIAKRESVGSWLYGVAHRIAVRMKVSGARRAQVERQTRRTLPPDTLAEVLWRDLRRLVDEEVAGLPERYRAAFILCSLQGKTNEEAARLLGCPVGTILSRLARARQQLRRRLIRRGIGLSTAVAATEGAQNMLSAGLSTALSHSTVQAALQIVHGQALPAVLSAEVAAVAEATIKALWLPKLGLTLALVLVVTGVGLGIGATRQAAAPTASQGAGQDPASAFTVNREAENVVTLALEQSDRNYVEMPSTFWDSDEPIKLTAAVSPVPQDAAPGTWKGNWAKMEAATGRGNPGRRYQIQLSIFPDGNPKAAWTGQHVLDPEPLARQASRFIPDERAYTHRDPEATVEFRIPPGTLAPGVYRVVLSFLDPDGAAHRFHYGETPRTGAFLVVRSATLDWKRLLLPSQVQDAPDLRTEATEIANPGRLQFPQDDPNDCQARSVWCLQEFQGRIYVGYGDWDRNRGPIDVWSFGADSAALRTRYPGRYSFLAGKAGRLLFTKEYTVQEESIDRFRVAGGKLLLPGIDGHKAEGPDGLVFASLYIREKGAWRKLSTLPAGHLLDVIEFEGRLLTRDQASEDGGLSWQDWAPGQSRHGDNELVQLGDGLLLLDGNGASLYRAGKLESHIMESFPGSPHVRPHRSTPFRQGVVYTSHHEWGRSPDPRHPLYFFRDFKEGVRVVELFRAQIVRDILAEGDRLYVLTGRAEGKEFLGEIFATQDLDHWSRLAAVRLPAMPSAFARLDGTFYVGLANRGYEAATYCERGPHQYTYADKAAGGIWRIERSGVSLPSRREP